MDLTELLFPTALLEAEFGGSLEPEGSLLADIDGDGDEVEEWMPLVWMPGGIGRLILDDTDCVATAGGAISLSRRV